MLLQVFRRERIVDSLLAASFCSWLIWRWFGFLLDFGFSIGFHIRIGFWRYLALLLVVHIFSMTIKNTKFLTRFQVFGNLRSC